MRSRACMVKFIIGFLVIAFLVTDSLSVATSHAEIIVSGSTTVQPLAEIWASEFNRLQQDYHISVHGGGSEKGIMDSVGNKSDIGMVSRKVNSEDRKYETDLKKFQIFLVGHDATCIVVSKNVYDAGVKNLTKEQVKQIYEGKIRNWREVGGPDHNIFLTAREPDSGTRNTFVESRMFGLYILRPDHYILQQPFNSVSIRFRNIPNLHPSGSLDQNAISGVCRYHFVSSDS